MTLTIQETEGVVRDTSYRTRFALRDRTPDTSR